MRTVIVRIFEPAPGSGDVDLCGFVEDVSRGASERFAGGAELLDTIQRVLQQADRHVGEQAGSATEASAR